MPWGPSHPSNPQLGPSQSGLVHSCVHSGQWQGEPVLVLSSVFRAAGTEQAAEPLCMTGKPVGFPANVFLMTRGWSSSTLSSAITCAPGHPLLPWGNKTASMVPEMSSRGTKLLLAGATSPPLWPQAAGRRRPCRRGLSGQDHRAPGRSSTSSQCMEQPVEKIFHLEDETFPSLHSQGGCGAVWFLSSGCCSPGQAALSLPWGQEADATLLLAPASSGGSSTSQLRAWNPLTRRHPSLQHSRTGILPRHRHRRCLSSKRGSEPPLGSSQGNGGWHPQMPAPAAPRASPGPGESGVIPPARVSPEHLG